MKKFLFVLITSLFLCIALFIWYYKKQLLPSSYSLDYAEGFCSFTNNLCQWVGDGCGGGHGKCTDNPKKYDGAISTCDINLKFPANQGYSCNCLVTIGKCAWVK